MKVKTVVAMLFVSILCSTISYAEEFIPPSGPSDDPVLMNSFIGMIDPAEYVKTDENTSYKKGEYRAVDYNIISVERLEDNIIDYDEIGSLVYFNNLTVNQISDALKKTRNDYAFIKEYLDSEKYWSKVHADDDIDTDDMEAYIENFTNYQIYKASSKSFKNVLKKLDSYSTQKNRIAVERQFAKAAQSLFIAYKNIGIQLTTLYQVRELYESLYNSTSVNMDVGYVTSLEVSKMQNTLEQTKIQITQLENTQEGIKKTLCGLLGLDADNCIIGDINYNNFEYVNNILYDRDLYFAKSNNKTYLDTRHTPGKSSYAMQIKDKKEQLQSEEIEIEFKSLYDSVNNNKASYDLARFSLENATSKWNSSLLQKELGMLTDTDLLQEKLAYIQAEVEYLSSELGYFQSIVNYDWATRGFLDID